MKQGLRVRPPRSASELVYILNEFDLEAGGNYVHLLNKNRSCLQNTHWDSSSSAVSHLPRQTTSGGIRWDKLPVHNVILRFFLLGSARVINEHDHEGLLFVQHFGPPIVGSNCSGVSYS